MSTFTPEPPEPGMGPPAPGQDEKMWAMLCHLSALIACIGIPFGNIIGPLVVWLIKKDQMPFVDDQGKEALNFQISVIIYAIVSAILIVVVIGIFLLIAVGIFWLVMIVVAGVKANGGQAYRYPLCIRLLK